MQHRIVDKPAFTIAGVAANTSVATQAADAPMLAARLFAPGFADALRGRVDPAATYALHADFDPEAQTYRFVLGFEVDVAERQPKGVDVLRVPAARYTVLTAVGPQPEASIDAWKEITAWRVGAGVRPTGAVSFEIHDARVRGLTPEVDIYIPAVAA
jgi:predicted transcriptional regulator YdeE